MKPGTLPLRASTRPICQLCDHILHRPGIQQRFLATKTLQAPARRPLPRAQHPSPAPLIRASISTSKRNKKHKIPPVISIPNEKKEVVPKEEEPSPTLNPDPATQAATQARYNEIHEELKDAEGQVEAIISSPTVPTEETVLKCLKQLGIVASSAIQIQAAEFGQLAPATIKQSSAASLLSLDKETPAPVSSNITYAELPTPSQISEIAYKLIKHPTIFITENVLKLYVQLQALLHRPATLPEILDLYSRKPIPKPGTSPIQYTKCNPKSAKSAIPANVADMALQTAIKAKNMGLCLDIIEASFARPAFIRAKMIRKALAPAVGVALTPFGLWVIAQEISLYSPAMDPDLLANYAFAGFMAYTLYTGTIGYVALTTSNDQMDRVTWVPGTPLRWRWLREEERAALDKVAQAWGFKERWRRGEEEGEDWEALREWCFLKHMFLDKTELMDGMQ